MSLLSPLAQGPTCPPSDSVCSCPAQLLANNPHLGLINPLR